MTRFLAAVAAVLVLVGCTTSSAPPLSPSTGAPSPAATRLPAGIPPSFEDDVAAGNVPAAALIPLGATVTDRWANETGDAIAVAWEFPGHDPFRKNRGVAVWRRFDDDGPPWRPVWGVAFSATQDNPVLGIETQFSDVTGDGVADALVSASLGGSGACGTTYVIDGAAGQIYRSEGCDRVIEPSSDPVGLRIREAEYAPGDPHCCPSSFRETVLVYEGGAWRTASSSVSPV